MVQPHDGENLPRLAPTDAIEALTPLTGAQLAALAPLTGLTPLTSIDIPAGSRQGTPPSLRHPSACKCGKASTCIRKCQRFATCQPRVAS
jgi:hypothetical protein